MKMKEEKFERFEGIHTADSKHYVVNKNLIGQIYAHLNGKRYVITGFAWNGDEDLWMIEHQEVGAIAPFKFVRSYSNFFGSVDLTESGAPNTPENTITVPRFQLLTPTKAL